MSNRPERSPHDFPALFESCSVYPLAAHILSHQLAHGVFDGTELRLLLLVLLLHRSGVFTVGD
ncbi:hypothetical protein VKM53_08090 [Providencia stuartii]|uniref:Uncharacterized protein n=1 Tax=Providencia stuartii TaxID=588 RepID=A0AAJ1JEX0_PROST|nr:MULTISPECIES: hypothetical protein [Providencia]MCB5219592.1 hypothetical protein [Providencia stuartii]MDE8749076.1 hypothetical protein [Providencia thailandensis]MDE8768378.1 hypothetical protein [Providencia thailandensis]MDE8772359.1 hypothetical protein [Providencia thailandensis]MDE8788880.1 hypothetical protein [Providencia thailandensis]